MASSSKKQTTMAKMTRERTVKEKRLKKQEKKDERKLAARMPAEETAPTEPDFEAEEPATAATLAP